MFFTSYEGYREESGVTVQGNVATQATRNRMMTSLPYPETKMVLTNTPLPNVPINDVIGRYTDAKLLTRRDNTFLGKVDFQAGAGRLSVTASRMRPFANVPRIQIENDQQYTNGSKRVSTNYVMTRSSWVSESRFGWNRNTLDRFYCFWLAESPTRGAQDDLYNVRKRISTFSVTGFFGSGDTEILALTYDVYNVHQEVTRPSWSTLDEVRVPVGARDLQKVQSANEPVHVRERRRSAGKQGERLPPRDGKPAT